MGFYAFESCVTPCCAEDGAGSNVPRFDHDRLILGPAHASLVWPLHAYLQISLALVIFLRERNKIRVMITTMIILKSVRLLMGTRMQPTPRFLGPVRNSSSKPQTRVSEWKAFGRFGRNLALITLGTISTIVVDEEVNERALAHQGRRWYYRRLMEWAGEDEQLKCNPERMEGFIMDGTFEMPTILDFAFRLSRDELQQRLEVSVSRRFEETFRIILERDPEPSSDVDIYFLWTEFCYFNALKLCLFKLRGGEQSQTNHWRYSCAVTGDGEYEIRSRSCNDSPGNQ